MVGAAAFAWPYIDLDSLTAERAVRSVLRVVVDSRVLSCLLLSINRLWTAEGKSDDQY